MCSHIIYYFYIVVYFLCEVNLLVLLFSNPLDTVEVHHKTCQPKYRVLDMIECCECNFRTDDTCPLPLWCHSLSQICNETSMTVASWCNSYSSVVTGDDRLVMRPHLGESFCIQVDPLRHVPWPVVQPILLFALVTIYAFFSRISPCNNPVHSADLNSQL